jgi:hypothetical protein
MAWKCRPCHLKRYLGLGDAGFEKLLLRAGYGNSLGETYFSLARAKTLLKYHFVMLAEKKPTKWKKNSRYQANRGEPSQGISLARRLVHPTLLLAQ